MSSANIEGRTLQEQQVAVRRATLDVSELAEWLRTTYGAVFRVLSEQGLTAIGPPFARFHFVAEGRCEAEAGFPVATEIAAEGDVIPSVLPGGLAATTVHIGPYEAMGPAYESLSSWVEEQNGEATGNAWEVYFSDPNAQPDPATWKTVIVQPYRLKEDAA